MRLLWRVHALPEFELQSAQLTVNSDEEDGIPLLRWEFDAVFYVVPEPETTTVFPFHKCSASLTIPSVRFSQDFDLVRLRAADPSSERYAAAGWSDARIFAPGRVIASGRAVGEGDSMPYDTPAILDLRLMPAAGDVPVSSTIRFNNVRNESTEETRLFRWSL